MDQKNILEIEDLKISFSGEEVVHGIDFSLSRGETLGVVGESGSGKSVTALSIMGLLSKSGKVSGGKIQFQSMRKEVLLLNQLKTSGLQAVRGNEISMIFQEPMTSLNPVFSCGDQVSEVIKLHKKVSSSEARKQTLELFKKVELPRVKQMYDSYPHQISGGQKQRVLIAMAISCEPTLLIADEPTTALDVTIQKKILDLIVRLQAEKKMAVIFISHDLGVVGEVADQVIMMHKGKIVESGSTKEIFDAPSHPYTKGLLACRPPIDHKPHRLLTLDTYLDSESLDNSLKENYFYSAEEIESRIQTLRTKEPFIEVKNLKTWYAVKPTFFWQKEAFIKAVDDVSFNVYPGETLGLVGESGCGKSTLGKSILRLIEPDSGEILYKGKNLLNLHAHSLREIRKELQIIFQDPYGSLNPRIPIGKSIIEPMKVHGIGDSDAERKEKALLLLKKVKMSEAHFSRFPHEFSGGQRQRICIARALAVNPRFMICDESVSALDVSVQAEVLNLLKDLQEELGLTYIFISHDLSVVKYMSDRMLVMENGKIVEFGNAEEIYQNPVSEYTRKLIAAIPPGTVEAIEEAKEWRRKLKNTYHPVSK